MKSIQPFIKIGLIISVIGLGFYSFFAYIDIQDYLDVNQTCAKAVDGFPIDKLEPLAKSGGLNMSYNKNENLVSFSNSACTCHIKINQTLVIENQGTFCAQK